MVNLNKKADGGLTAIVIIIIIIVFLGWLVNLGGRECNSNKDCREDSYCGSDFNCHEIPVIERTTTVTKRSPTAPMLIISLTLIILAIIFRWEKIFKKREKAELETPRGTETPESYYTSQFQYTAK